MDRVAAKLHLYIKRFVEWNCNSLVALFWSAKVTFGMLKMIVLHVQGVEQYSLEYISFYFNTIGMVGPFTFCTIL